MAEHSQTEISPAESIVPSAAPPVKNLNPSTASSAPLVTVHHLNNSRSQRILWLLEELEVPYEIKKYYRTAEQRAPKELLAITPLGKSPVITDGNITLAESGAIVEYLILKYGKDKVHVPESCLVDNLYFTHYAEGSLMPILVQKIIFDIVPKKSPGLVRPLVRMLFEQLDKMIVAPEISKNLEFIEGHLNKTGGWFASGSADNITSADYMMAFPLEALVASHNAGVGSKMKEYVSRIHARPAYKKALEKGGEYAYGPKK